ncbi:MAG: HypC/HybG/HupF family hydrogenase formation chaperone [Acidimicrobiales bacterium]
MTQAADQVAGAIAPEDRVSASLALAALTLAKRFAAGATMWCVAPEWRSHGRHVAVEFVHPVIVGKRSLPTMNVEPPAAVAKLRLLARPGDVLLVVSTAEDALATDLLRRSEAWGLTRVWLGAGRAPGPSAAEHILWSDTADPREAAMSGEIVLLYHLMWELTHVVFEHPGLLDEEKMCTDDVCITCSDEGRIAEVRAVLDECTATGSIAGVNEEIEISLVQPVNLGDLLLVHAGVALARIDPLDPSDSTGHVTL